MRILRILRILLFPTQSTTREYGPSDSSMGEADGSFAHESCGLRAGLSNPACERIIFITLERGEREEGEVKQPTVWYIAKLQIK